MRVVAALLVAWALAWPVASAAQDASVEITQAALSKLVQRVGPFSNAGVYKPSTPAGNSGSLFGRCEYVGYLDCPLASRGERELRPLVKCELKPTLRRPAGAAASLSSFSKVVLVPAADPAVTYEWWIDDPSLAVGAGSMTFTASVRSRVGAQTNTETRTVPAQVAWEPAGRRLRLSVGAFVVPLRLGSTTVASVDVARFYNLTLPIQPQTFLLRLPDGSSRNINARPVSGSVQYQPGRAVLNFALGF
jgi:hypothetical protein